MIIKGIEVVSTSLNCKSCLHFRTSGFIVSIALLKANCFRPFRYVSAHGTEMGCKLPM